MGNNKMKKAIWYDDDKFNLLNRTYRIEKKLSPLLFIIIILFCAIIISTVYLKIAIDSNWKYGYENAVHLFQDKCEKEGLSFQYITQGRYLRCENSSIVKFYDIKFTFRDSIK